MTVTAEVLHDEHRAIAEAQSWDTTPERLAELMRDPRLNVRHAAAVNIATPGESLAAAEAGARQVHEAAARNPNLPVNVMRRWWRHDLPLRRHLASNTSLPEDLAHEGSRNLDVSVLAALATNRGAPEDVLGVLALHDNAGVSSQACTNSSTPTEALIERQRRGDLLGIVDTTLNARVSTRFGVYPDNVEAIRMLREVECWWQKPRHCAEACLALALHPNS